LLFKFQLYTKLYWSLYGVHGWTMANPYFAFRTEALHIIPKTTAPNAVWGGRVEMLLHRDRSMSRHGQLAFVRVSRCVLSHITRVLWKPWWATRKYDWSRDDGRDQPKQAGILHLEENNTLTVTVNVKFFRIIFLSSPSQGSSLKVLVWIYFFFPKWVIPVSASTDAYGFLLLKK
jgi:hypothetical protein